jgi:hypothetical protein
MARNLTAQDRASLIRLASTLPVGSPQRKAILAGLTKKATKSKFATDPQEMADVLSLSLKKGQDYSYEDLLGILVEESGTRQAARYLESAIEILVSDGILRRTPSGYRRG